MCDLGDVTRAPATPLFLPFTATLKFKQWEAPPCVLANSSYSPAPQGNTASLPQLLLPQSLGWQGSQQVPGANVLCVICMFCRGLHHSTPSRQAIPPDDSFPPCWLLPAPTAPLEGTPAPHGALPPRPLSAQESHTCYGSSDSRRGFTTRVGHRPDSSKPRCCGQWRDLASGRGKPSGSS